MNLVSLFGALFAAIGGGLLFMAARKFVERRAFLRNSAVASGSVVGLTQERDGIHIHYFPKVAFKTTKGIQFSFQSGMGSMSQRYQIGDSVTVRYQLDQPNLAEIDSFATLWLLPLTLALLGDVFLIVGLGLLIGLLPV